MNPFELAGPAFLVFYTVLGVVCLLGVFAVRRLEPGGLPKTRLTDPYEVACLRGGVHAALRIAVLRLVDAGLLKRSGDSLEQTPQSSFPQFEHPVEESVWKHFESARAAGSVFDLAPEAAVIREDLVKKGLLPDARQTTLRRAARLSAFGLLAAVSTARIAEALSRGHSNILYLLGLTLVFGVIVFFYNPARTPAGDRTLRALKSLGMGLKARVSLLRAGQGSRDLVMAAALFGIGILPGEFSYATELFPKAERASSGSSSSGCGSACGSAGGDSGSSSGCGGCGGGGCGGGCGG